MSAMRPLRWIASAAALAGAAAFLGGCEPPAAEDLVLGPRIPAPFEVERTSADAGSVEAGAQVVVRFTGEVDAASIGPRAVRVVHAKNRRSVRVRASGAGRELRIAPLHGRGFPTGAKLLLRVEGSPSPRAVRSTRGETLARPHVVEFAVAAPRADLVGPRLQETLPRDGDDDVVPGSPVELRFDEPLAAGAVASGDAATLRVGGSVTPARLTLSGDGRKIVVHPQTPLPPGRSVSVEVHDCVLDAAGNPLDPQSPRTVSFRTRDTFTHQLTEEFVDAANSDLRATSCGWDDLESPGYLTARGGTILVGPEPAPQAEDLGEDSAWHFQIVVAGDEVPSGIASALRLEFTSIPLGAHVLKATVDGGATELELREPTFDTNRAAANLRPLCELLEPVEIVEDAAGGGAAEIVFDEPLRLEAGVGILLDVRVEASPGSRLAAYPDTALRCLAEGCAGLAPAAALVVTPAAAQARSTWYDSGVAVPGWGACTIVRADTETGVAVVTEFQSAPPDAHGLPDVSRSSPWERDLARLPAYRFVRFRLRFEGTPEGGYPPRIERMVLPFER